MEANKTFYLTFGKRFHPVTGVNLLDWWIEVHAPDYMTAKDYVFRHFGQRWSSLYDKDDWDPSYFPKGVHSSIMDCQEIVRTNSIRGFEEGDYI